MEYLTSKVIILKILFDFFTFYQQKHFRIFEGSSQGYYYLLTTYCTLSGLFSIGFLIFWGFHFTWSSAGLLFVISFIGSTILTLIEVVIAPSKNSIKIALIGLVGIIALPVLGYFLIL